MVRTNRANQRQHLNKTQHQTGSINTSQPFNHAGLGQMVVASRQC
ncbi:hypothetical protein [Halomonas denitrificans]|nr:hypothetical protein [Halomonas denitrificans]